jgi:hypothetical protein
VTGNARSIEVYNPFDSSLIATIDNHSVEDCLAAARRAQAAFPAWAATAPRERGEILRRVWELMIRDRENLARLITTESGKVLADALAEVNYAPSSSAGSLKKQCVSRATTAVHHQGHTRSWLLANRWELRYCSPHGTFLQRWPPARSHRLSPLDARWW